MGLKNSITTWWNGRSSDSITTLNIEKRSGLENPHVPLSLALATIGVGVPTDSNERITEFSSLEIPTVLSCVRILSEGIASLPLRVYESLPDRGKKLAKEHSLYRLLTLEPNDDMTAMVFWSTIGTALVVWQNAYAEIERNPQGQPIALWPRIPWLTKPVRNNGILQFETTDTPNGAKRIIKAEDMLHFVGFTTDGIQGRSLIHLARQTVGLAMAATRYGARFFANNARPGGVIELDHQLDPEDMTRLRADVEAMQSGSNTHRVAIMPQGLKWSTIAVNPVESEFINTQKFSVGEIAAFFRVPGYMVGALEKVLKSTVEAQNSEFLSYSLRPWLNRIEQEVERKLLPPIGRNSGKYTVRFFVDELLRSDYATRVKGYQTGIISGWYSANDVRELLDESPIPNGDIYYSPLQLLPASESNEPLGQDDTGEPDDDNTTVEPGADATTVSKAPAPTPDDEPETKSIFLPFVKDAIGRTQARAKKDSAAMKRAFEPIAAGLRAHMGVSKQLPDTYYDEMATRCLNWNEESADAELSSLINVVKEAA